MTPEAQDILDTALRLTGATEVTPDWFGGVNHPKAIHESCLRSFGLLRLSKDLIARQWPADAILVTLELAERLSDATNKARAALGAE